MQKAVLFLMLSFAIVTQASAHGANSHTIKFTQSSMFDRNSGKGNLSVCFEPMGYWNFGEDFGYEMSQWSYLVFGGGYKASRNEPVGKFTLVDGTMTDNSDNVTYHSRFVLAAIDATGPFFLENNWAQFSEEILWTLYKTKENYVTFSCLASLSAATDKVGTENFNLPTAGITQTVYPLGGAFNLKAKFGSTVFGAGINSRHFFGDNDFTLTEYKFGLSRLFYTASQSETADNKTKKCQDIKMSSIGLDINYMSMGADYMTGDNLFVKLTFNYPLKFD